MTIKQWIAAGLTAGMLLTAMPALAEEAPAAEAVEAVAGEAPVDAAAIVDTQKLDASYTLALNAINAEDYETAKEYLNVCFAYCDPVGNPTMYADLLLKRACIDVIEEKNDMALLQLDAAIRVQPDLADAYLVRTQVYAAQGEVDAAIENLEKYALTQANSDGKAGAGRSVARTDYGLHLRNTVWVDDAKLEAPNSKVLLEADNGDGFHARIETDAHGEMYATGGTVSADIFMTGASFNQIRTNDKNSVKTLGSFIHEIDSPQAAKNINFQLGRRIKRAFATTVDRSEQSYKVAYSYRCDFCERGNGSYVLSGIPESAQTILAKALEKALSPLVDIQRMLEQLGISKARYGEEDYTAAAKIFALEHPVALEKDATLTNERILKYRLWANAETGYDVFLLPNATRMYGTVQGDRIKLQYVAEVIRGDVRGNGELRGIDVITALTPYALSHPIIPIGSAGALDFSAGTLVLPSKSDYELYLHEISGAWLIEMMESGFIRMLSGDQNEIDEAVIKGRELPSGEIVEGLSDGGEQDGWKLYWMGDSPETAADPDQVLVGLLVNPDTDEADAFRTSVNMLERGEAPVDVSLYLYRDSKSDRMEIEKYGLLWLGA